MAIKGRFSVPKPAAGFNGTVAVAERTRVPVDAMFGTDFLSQPTSPEHCLSGVGRAADIEKRDRLALFL